MLVAVTDLASVSRAIFDRALGLLEVFDLSFFISGAAFMAALFFADLLPGSTLVLGLQDEQLNDVPALGWGILILASYVAGLACFSLGRSVGRRAHSLFSPPGANASVFRLMANHSLVRQDQGQWQATLAGKQIDWLERYLQAANEPSSHAEKAGVESALYVRMWAELRLHKHLSNSFGLLRRYWVSAATLDGLFIAGVAWALVLWTQGYTWGAIASVAGGCLSSFEARRYDQNQRRELVATMAQLYDDRARDAKSRVPRASL